MALAPKSKKREAEGQTENKDTVKKTKQGFLHSYFSPSISKKLTIIPTELTSIPTELAPNPSELSINITATESSNQESSNSLTNSISIPINSSLEATSISSIAVTSNPSESDRECTESVVSRCESDNSSTISTFRTYPWIVNTPSGYFCSICKNLKNGNGKWITEPIEKSNSKKLYKKAAKHNKSEQHQKAVYAATTQSKSSSVAEQLIIHSQRQNEDNTFFIKALMKISYFLFKNEIPHSTNYRNLVSTAFSLDSSGKLKMLVKTLSARSNYLSRFTTTMFLESFSSAINTKIKNAIPVNGLYSIMADEATDSSSRQILSVFIRYLKNNEIIECLLDTAELENATAIYLKEKNNRYSYKV